MYLRLYNKIEKGLHGLRDLTVDLGDPHIYVANAATN